MHPPATTLGSIGRAPPAYSRPAPPAGVASRGRTALWIAAALILLQLVVRTALVTGANFYWDDLVLIGRASELSTFSWEYLMYGHDGHLMPGAFLVVGVSTDLAPLNWAVPAITLVVGQLLASVAVLRMLIVIAGRMRPVLLIPLAFYLFTPLTVPAYTWWSAGLNTLPMQIAMAVVVTEAVQLCRGEVMNRRLVIGRALIVFVIGLAFFEKSVLIVPVAMAAAAIWCLLSGRGATIGQAARAAWVSAHELWIGLCAITAAWLAMYLVVVPVDTEGHSVGQTLQIAWRSVSAGLIPGLLGGPWDWERWLPSPPFGSEGWQVKAIGWLLVLVAAGYALYTRRHVGWVLAAVAGYVFVLQIPIIWNRTGAHTTIQLAQTLRYLPDSALVITLAMALILVAQTSGRRIGHSQLRWVRPAAVVAVVAFIVSSLIATQQFSKEWRTDPTGEYLTNARASLAESRDTPMFDHQLPIDVLLPLVKPYNTVSKVFGSLSDRPEFDAPTDKLQVLDDSGRLVPAAITPVRITGAGLGDCGNPEVTGPTDLELDGPLIVWSWKVALPYCATTDGEIEVGLADGDPVTAPVKAGLNAVYVQLHGGGTQLRVRPLTPGLRLHVGQSRVGELVRVP
ncbi:UNVERIFIED_CONTAM: hypothetical protein DES50_105201 [Williamsia faeni]